MRPVSVSEASAGDRGAQALSSDRAGVRGVDEARVWALGAWLSLGVVLYFTLLPFRFGDLSLREAWEIYRAMELYELRPRARQQWVANVLMFVPLGFFWTGWLARRVTRAGGRVVVGVGVALLGLAVTASVEFVQAWIPARVPSPIDLSGNFTGAVLGVALWFVLAPRLDGWRAALRTRGLEVALVAYALTYVAASLLPFDLLLSAGELRQKFGSDHWGLWAAGAGCAGGVRCGIVRALELAACVPIGMLVAMRLPSVRARGWISGLGAGVAFGIALELGQFLTVSGIAEGRSVLLRALGVLAGIAIYAHRDDLLARASRLVRHGRLLVACAAVPYVILLVTVNVGVRGFSADPAQALATLSEISFLPFYYHYLVPESVAIASVVLHFAMYAPVGILVWMWNLAEGRAARPAVAALWGGGAAFVMESAKLFYVGRHPDYTDVLIGCAAAAAALWVAQWTWWRAFATARPAEVTDAGGELSVVVEAADDAPKAPPVAAPSRVVGAALGIGTILAAFAWPVAGLWLVLALTAYAALLWRRPEAWLFVIPALVPVLDLSLHTGWVVVDELDLFVLATLAVAAWRWRAGRGFEPLPRTVRWSLALFGASLVIALLVALFPWRAPDANDWAQYTSPYNALRAVKGFLWALLLYALLRQSDLPVMRQLQSWFVPGVATGLALGLVVIVCERIAYPGLFDFDSRYRLAGAFTDMRAGGPSIETWLVMAAPFALLWGWQRRSVAGLVGGVVLLAFALFGLAVTYSRGGYLGMGVALMIVLAGAIAAVVRADGVVRRGRLALLMALPALAAIAIGSQVAGGFADQRMAQIGDDLEERRSHWALARDLSRAAGGAGWWGHGAGSFPRTYLAGNPLGRVPGNFRLVRGPEGALLRIGTGDSLYINQRIDPPRAGEYRLRARIRSDARSALRVFVCEKHIRYSFACRSTGWVAPGDGEWVEREWTFSLDGFDDRPWPVRRGLTLALSAQGGLLDLDRIELTGPGDRSYVRNGTFEDGMRHWYMTTDHLWPWRIENQWIETWFDQGWPGLLAFVALVAAAVWRLAGGALRGHLPDALLLASIAGALTIAAFGTIFWSPRIMLLFFLVLLLACTGKKGSGEKGVSTLFLMVRKGSSRIS